MENIFLSKSSYCKSVQCPKIIWLKKYKSNEAVQHTKQSIFETGKKVGIVAQDLFGKEHYDVEYNFKNNYRYMYEQTNKFLQKKPNIITEATFNYENNFCMVDILKNDDDGVEIYEVKSSTHVTDVYMDDASFQYFVLSNLGFNVKKVCIVYINNQYIRGKKLDLNQLFNIEDITDYAIQQQEKIRNKVEYINKFMNEHDKTHEPDIPIGKQCSNPYKCDYIEYCNSKLENININPDESEDNLPLVDIDKMKDVINSLKYPLYFIDYETINPAIPEYECTKPYQQLPFQYSLHILRNENDSIEDIEHKEFLAQADDKEFIRHFSESLVNEITEEGSVIVYNESMEKTQVNKQLIRMYPDLEEKITRINDNIVDFMKPFKKQYYANNKQGKYSIKYVLPALYPDNPDLDYENLEGVHKGDEASEVFLSMKNKTPQEQEEIRKELLEYCKLDTYALVKIYEKFR